jgi:hypothetical protein
MVAWVVIAKRTYLAEYVYDTHYYFMVLGGLLDLTSDVTCEQ